VGHAGAERIEVRLSAGRRQIVVSVTDDGRGVDGARRRGGAGIDNMRTRARLVGATFSLGRGPEGTGTVVRLALVPAEESEAAT
jgi:signal transduction histidine kinase